MRYRADSLGLSGTVTTLLMDVIHDRLGLQYGPNDADQVADRLAPLVVARGLDSFMDYYYVLKYSSTADEWSRVMDALSVQETYFWREIDQLRALVEDVVPRLVDELDDQPLRIWSAACASGEEPLTIAMLLTEAGWFDRARIEILGTDASPLAIARARTAHYTKRSFRNLPAALQQKYFRAEADHWNPIPDLSRRVSYDVVNLMDDARVSRLASTPVVVCRNVFIYFSDRSIGRVLNVFGQSMPSPGYLCVGVSESLLRRTSLFELKEIGGAFMYLKGAQRGSSSVLMPRLETAS